MTERRSLNGRPTLEQRIIAALNNPNAGSADLAELVAETETAATAAEQSAKDAYDKAIDLMVTPDASEANQAASAAALTRDRLANVLPKLRSALSAALAKERLERWQADHARLRPKRDAVAARFAETYKDAVAKLLAAFQEAETLDREIDHLHGDAPPGVGERLVKVSSSRLAGTQLFDFDTGTKVWPPHQIPLGVEFVQSMRVDNSDPRIAQGRWHEVAAEREAAAAEATRRRIGDEEAAHLRARESYDQRLG
jgi:hypothetical protein